MLSVLYRKLRLVLVGLALVVGIFIPRAARAEFGAKSKWGIDVERLQNGTSGEYGVLVGFRHLAYFDSSSHNNVYLGYEIHAGTNRGGSLNDDNLTYGGMSLGFDGSYFRSVAYDFSLLVGYGFGNVTRYSISAQSLAIQPTVSFGLIMLAGFRASFSAGYLYMPSATPFSTWVFGIHLERKTSSSSSSYAE